MKRLIHFLRSVLPADPYQLLFLAGVVCLTIAPHSRWWPSPETLVAAEKLSGRQLVSDEVRVQFGRVLLLARWPLIFAAAAGYFVCFWPGRRPVSRILWWVGLPMLVGLVPICGWWFLRLQAQPRSVLEGTHRIAPTIAGVPSVLWGLGPGLHFCLLGLFLTLMFAARLAFGISFLPIVLHRQQTRPVGDAKLWRRLQIVIWILVGPIAGMVMAFPAILGTFLVLSFPAGRDNLVWVARLTPIIGAATSVAAVAWGFGKGGWILARGSMRLFKPIYLVLAFVFPLGIGTLIPTSRYLLDRAHWAAHDFGRYFPPQFETYFSLPDPWLLLLFFAALGEEIIFRGMLQPRFIERYGAIRGIFLVGVVWTAFHFFGDSYYRLTDLGTLRQLAFRLFVCLALNFVFGWLTLRSNSVLPAAIAHTVYNVLTYSGFGPNFYFTPKNSVMVALWALLAYALFRYWPVNSETEPQASVPPATRALAI